MYDYVIVGTGSAGSVIAARLSEDPDVSVCVVEAGGPDDVDIIPIPAMFGDLFRTKVDWDYDSADEPGLGNRRIFLPRGKTLGGSSSINAMLYIRSHRNDYDSWGQPGWSYDELLPFFRRCEDNERGESEFHGVGGPMHVSEGRSNNVMSKALVDAALAMGYPFNDDFNAGDQDGFGYFQLTQYDGRRWSTANGYLHPASERPNLTVITHFEAHKVLIENSRAVGVVGERFDELITLRAEREVIVCAGAYNSPKLLMLSGIGPADELGMLGVDIVLDQPEVGRNLSDHTFTPMIFTHSQPVSLLIAHTPEAHQQFEEEGRGPLTSNGPECGGFVRTRDGLDGPDVVFFAGPLMFADSGLSMPTDHAITYGPIVLTPRSRGRISLIGADPSTKPKIEHNYFAEPEDLRSAMDGVRIGLEIARQAPMAPYTETHHQTPASDSAVDIEAFVRRRTHPIFHPGGTCSMGKVVDEQLRVMGIDGLRVADVSIMPTLGRGAPNASAIVIGERAADLIAGSAATLREAA